jgi:GT2 family glycosyltransferase
MRTEAACGGAAADARVMPRVSIICVTYNRRDFTLSCLDSCVRQTYPNLEIIAFVNPSGDGTEQAIAERFPQVRMYTAHCNIGFFPALNLSIANASGEYIMTVDDDARFIDPDAVERLIEAFQREPELGAVTCNLDGPSETPIAGHDRYVHLYTTGFTMVPREIFTAISYYPDLFWLSGGESVMCADLWERGYRIKRLAGVRMYHARAMQGRFQGWEDDSIRCQALYAVMREPWWILVPSLTSKFARSFVQLARVGRPGGWVRTWIRVAGEIPEALRSRRSIRWKTQRMLWKLRQQVVTDVAALEALNGR